MTWCSHCKRDRPECRDYCSGSVACLDCGKVFYQDVLTEEPLFVKGSAGESQVAGTFVKSIQSDDSEKLKRTLNKGTSHIHEMAVYLDIRDDNIKMQAETYYKKAVGSGFTRGRETNLVAAACFYIACRDNNKPVLLIDFSTCLNINVYVLGAVFLQLCKLLLNLQEHLIVQKLVDPTLFIAKFTNKLLGQSNMKVSRTAMNLVASMKRDWMQTGRKPSGICGAAIYISALSHGFNCSKADIVKLVNVCEATLSRRLIEFENTDSGNITIEEMNKNAKELEKVDHLCNKSRADSQNFKKMEVLCKHKDRKPQFAGLCESCFEDFIKLSGGLHGGAEPPAFQRAESERLAKASSKKFKDSSFILEPQCREEEESSEVLESVTESRTAAFKGSVGSAVIGDETTLNDASDKIQLSNDTSFVDKSDSFSDIDEDEVNSYLLDEEERYLKKIIWEELNKEFLQEQAAKGAAAASSGEERRHKRTSKAKNPTPAKTPLEAMHQMLTKKRLSSKINYDVLEKHFDDQPLSDSKRTRVEPGFFRKDDAEAKQYSFGENVDIKESDEDEPGNVTVENMGTGEAYNAVDYNYYDDNGDDYD